MPLPQRLNFISSSSSNLNEKPICLWTRSASSKANRVTWWMGLYGSATPKRHVAYSNSFEIRQLNLGPLRGWAAKVKAREAAGIQATKTVVKYIDKSGRLRYKGSKALKFSESDTHLFKVLFGMQLLLISQTQHQDMMYPSLPNTPPLPPSFRPGTIQQNLDPNLFPFLESWSRRSRGCLSCRLWCRQRKKCLNKWILMTNGKMQKCNPYVTT